MVITDDYFTVKKMKKTLLLTILFFTALPVFAKVTELTASVDRNPVMETESFVLTVTANDSVNNVQLDFSVLENNFVVGRTSISRQTQLLNLKASQTTTWITTLYPKAIGNFTIPSFTIEDVASAPIDIMVIQPNAQIGARQDLFITSSVDKEQVYLQQQLLYTSKLYVGVNLQRGSLAAPKLANADVQQLGEDKKYSELYEGKRYEVIERNFAIIPQQSGSFTIEGPIFEGEVAQAGGQTFSFFNRIKPMTRIAPNVEIEVLPIPNDYTGHWLPSEFVVLNEEWQPELDEYKIGEPITRTLTLTAVGLVEAQLPDFTVNYPSNVKSYPDQSETASVEKDGALIGQRVQSVALIPSSSGSITIPELSIPWFNTKTGKTDYATLPSRTLTVAPNAGEVPLQIPASETQPEINQTEPQEGDENEVLAPTHLTSSTSTLGTWTSTTTILLVLWLLTMFLWATSYVLSKRKNSNLIDKSEDEKHPQAANSKALHVALKTNQSSQIVPALARWLNHYLGQQSLSLSACISMINQPELEAELNKMFEAEYGKANESWNSDKLANLIKQIKSQKPKHKNKNTRVELKPLYPQ